MHAHGSRCSVGLALLVAGCSAANDDGDDDAPLTGLGEATSPIDGGDDDGAIKLDGADTDGAIPCPEGQVCEACEVSEHPGCDDDPSDVFAAIGLGCADGPDATVSTRGSAAAIGTRTGFGSTENWLPREGQRFAVLGSGVVADLDLPTPAGDPNAAPTHCNDDLGAFDVGMALPAPLLANGVTGDCVQDPTLLGTGDCSNTIEGQFVQGGSANDYTELRIEAVVPPSNDSLAYDFAFLSTEYPYYSDTAFNDMVVGWLESERWTGNISFDADGNPISLNAGFLDFRDTDGDLPEFAGTCMRQHAATRWLSTTAPVTPGESITLVFAIFDLSDSNLDSFVFLDDFRWGCEGTDHPTTQPVG
jgi:hypothetical protein